MSVLQGSAAANGETAVVTVMTGICIHSADSNFSVVVSVVAVKAVIVSQQTRDIEPDVCTMLGQLRRRWADTVPTNIALLSPVFLIVCL